MTITAAVADRRVRVEQVMGTVIGLDLRPPWIEPEVVEAFFLWLKSVDERFSTFKDGSLVSRLRRGELDESGYDADLREILELCERVRLASAGAFDVWTHNPAGVDPSGLVKGWSIDRGAAILRAGGARNFCINAGGDVLAAGESTRGSAWRVGIRHPSSPEALVKVVGVRDQAVATSGSYERGAHITNSAVQSAPTELLSLTVVGVGLTLTDAYATAAFAMGEAGISWVAAQPHCGVCAVTANGRTVWDEQFATVMAPSAEPQ
ncbi:MAG: FAD:protein FMN transferase [Candidatus Dormibacteria bacterium]